MLLCKVTYVQLKIHLHDMHKKLHFYLIITDNT